jgi:hypothetical protein
MNTMHRQIVLAARPEGLPKPSDFRLIERPAPERAEVQRQVAPWIKEGKVKCHETIVDGLEHALEAFIGLFHSENVGSSLIGGATDLNHPFGRQRPQPFSNDGMLGGHVVVQSMHRVAPLTPQADHARLEYVNQPGVPH